MPFTLIEKDVLRMKAVETCAVYDVLQYCKLKEQLVLVRKFWLGGVKPEPLQRIGYDYGLTRERMRQIEAQALMRFRRLLVGNDRYAWLLDLAKKTVVEAWWIMGEDALIMNLYNAKISSFSQEEIRLIIVSDFDLSYLKRNKYIDTAFYLDPLYEDLLTHIAVNVSSFFLSRGESQSIYECVDSLKSTYTRSYPDVHFLRNDKFYTSFLPLIRWIVVFDGKVWLDTFTDVNPKTIKMKLLYTMRKLKEPMHFEKLPAAVMKFFPKKKIKVSTVHNELVKNNTIFVNLWLGTYGLAEWWYKGWTVVEVLFRILKAFWRPMTVKEIWREMSKDKLVLPNTIILNLQKYKNVFERIEKWVYVIKSEIKWMDEAQFKAYIQSQK